MLIKKMKLFVLICLITTKVCLAEQNFANSLSDAFTSGSTNLNFRLRHENARQDLLSNAKATTLRSQLSYETAKFNQSTINIELTDVSNFLGQKYNPDSIGLQKPQYAKIADPKGTGLTSANLKYEGIDATQITLGRQYIQLDNERFIGKEDFRQFPQSFDAISINNQMLEQVDFFYGYIQHFNNTKNNRSEDGRHRLRTHLINLAWNGFNYGKLTAYAYFNKDKTITSNSHSILGVRANSDENYVSIAELSYSLEVARQSGKFGNPNRYSANYFMGEIGKTIDQIFTIFAGVEHLGGDTTTANKSFNTPLASNNSFLGAADAFITTPTRGIQDYFFKLSSNFGEFSFSGIYHHFRFAAGSTNNRAGSEVDLGGTMHLNEQIKLSASYANFKQKNNSATSTRRFRLTLDAKFL